MYKGVGGINPPRAAPGRAARGVREERSSEVRGLLFSIPIRDKLEREMGFPTKEGGRGETSFLNTMGRRRKGLGRDRILLSWGSAEL